MKHGAGDDFSANGDGLFDKLPKLVHPKTILGSQALWIALLVLALPLVLEGYYVYLLSLIGVYAIVSLGLNLLTGYGGLLSVGHAGFFAIGSYTYAILLAKVDVPFWVAALAAGVLTAMIGFLVGLPALRLSGFYLAMATLGFGRIVQQVILRWDDLTGGAMGVYAAKPSLGGFVFDTDHKFYYLVVIYAAFFIWLTNNIVRSKLGRAFTSIRDNELAAQSLGISLARYKTLAFTISAFYTGVAGTLFVSLIGYVNVGNFDLLTSVFFFVMIIVGGRASILGSILGAAFLTAVPELLRDLKDQQELIYGMMLILVIRFAPLGMRDVLARLFRTVWARVTQRVSADAVA